MARGHKAIALRVARGHASTASLVAHEGQKRLSKAQLTRMERIREGRCPSCGDEVSEDIKAGRVVVRGHVVNKCDRCRVERRETRPDRGRREETVATLMGERLTQMGEIDHAVERFKANKDSKILIVGVQTNNVQREARDHPRIIMWMSADNRGGSSLPTIPSAVSIIMCTRFCSHQMSQYLQRSAKDRKIFMFQGLLAPGEMRRHLAELLDLDRNKAHEGADDNNGLPPLPPMKPAFTAPNPKPEAPVKTPPQAPAPILALSTPPTGGNATEKIDHAIKFIREANAAMELVVESLEGLKEVIAQNAEAAETVAMFKKLLNK